MGLPDFFQHEWSSRVPFPQAGVTDGATVDVSLLVGVLVGAYGHGWVEGHFVTEVLDGLIFEVELESSKETGD